MIPDLFGPTDRPALLAVQNDQWLALAQTDLTEMGYKVHRVHTHNEFISAFLRTRYQLVFLGETFDSTGNEENRSLRCLQTLPMSRRRHAAVVLLGSLLQTLNPLQAFQLSVHAVIQETQLSSLKPILEQVILEQDRFRQPFLEVQRQFAAGGK